MGDVLAPNLHDPYILSIKQISLLACSICCRFFLGGTTTLRGFGMWGVGPHESGYSLGGEIYWAVGLHLYHPLPFIHGQINRYIKLHAFLTTGKLFGYGIGMDDASVIMVICIYK